MEPIYFNIVLQVFGLLIAFGPHFGQISGSFTSENVELTTDFCI